MKNKLLKMASLFITPILILFLLTVCLDFRLTGNHFESKSSCISKTIYSKSNRTNNCSLDLNDQAESAYNMQQNLSKTNNLFTSNTCLAKFLSSKNQNYSEINQGKMFKESDIELMPGGESVGVRLSCKGILVVGFTNFYDSKNTTGSTDIHIGDMITEVNSEKVKTSKELISKVKTLDEDQVTLTIIRNNQEKSENVKLYNSEDGDKKIGLWVRDTTAGVGTMTFYSKNGKVFGALGHPVIDGDTNECFEISGGNLLKSSVISIRKGEKGNPGELKGIFIDDKEPIGNIETNTNCGIFGKYKSKDIKDKKALKVASRDEIKEGPAKIITTIDEDGPKEYDINIEKLYTQNEPGPKSMVIKITDKELLDKTGGIVQGMSGSPIIQNDKIVGAVTHVLINRPDTGYGIYIDWMIQETDIVK